MHKTSYDTARVALIIIGAIALVATALLAVDHLSAGDSLPVHQLTALSLLAICLTVVGSYAVIARSRRSVAAPLQIEELQREKRAAENANVAKSRYLASVSHEIRSPLNAIYGYAQLVERDDGVSPREAAKVIRRCAEHLNSLVEGLLDISQVEKGVLRVKPDVVRFDPFLEQIVSMYRPSAAAKGLAFEYIAPQRLPEFVRMDQSRLRQVLINLLSNAIKYTDAGTVTFKVSYAGQMARFEIRDTGRGISAEDRVRIFQPFERGLADAQAERPGFGLGLPISNAIVDLLGGKLEMNSVPGMGTVFQVTLMVAEVAGKLEDRAAVRHVTGYLGPRRSVLLADDDPEQLSFLQTLLDSLGFDTCAVPDGETALARCEGRTFDLAILDITMPGLSGWETAMRLRDTCRHDLRIIMLSANSQEFHKPEFPCTAHDLFLLKPVQFGALVEAIGGLLALSWTWGQPEVPLAPSSDTVGSIELNEVARQHLARLTELLRIGYLRGIEAEVRQLAEADPAALGLVDELVDMLDRFDLSGMMRRLEAA
jgi:signal transduction histidine kinase/CheY-like chemotaxis protein